MTPLTIVPTQVIGPELKMAIVQITMDSSYPTGGEVWDTSGYDMTTIFSAVPMGDAKADYGYTFGLTGTRANGGITAHATDTKLVAYWQTDTATAPSVEVTNATDLSAVVLTMLVIGQ